MAKIIEASETLDNRTIYTAKAIWGEFSIDADKAVEAVADFLSHYRRSRMGGYALDNSWIVEAANALSDKCVLGSVEDENANRGCRV